MNEKENLITCPSCGIEYTNYHNRCPKCGTLKSKVKEEENKKAERKTKKTTEKKSKVEVDEVMVENRVEEGYTNPPKATYQQPVNNYPSYNNSYGNTYNNGNVNYQQFPNNQYGNYNNYNIAPKVFDYQIEIQNNIDNLLKLSDIAGILTWVLAGITALFYIIVLANSYEEGIFLSFLLLISSVSMIITFGLSLTQSLKWKALMLYDKMNNNHNN